MAANGKSRRAGLAMPQVNDHPLRAWLAVARAYQTIQRQLERILDEAGLTLPQFDVLANLGMSEGITQQELAGRLLVTKGNVCGVLDRMEEADLVERRPDPRDRRANRLYLTGRGRGALREAFPAHLGVVQRHMAALSDEQCQLLCRLLATVENGELSD